MIAPPNTQRKSNNALTDQQKYGAAGRNKHCWKGFAAVFLCLAIVATIGILFWPTTPEELVEKPDTNTNKVHTIRAPKSRHLSDNGKSASLKIAETQKYKGVEISSQTFTTNQNGRVIEEIVTKDGRKHRIFHDPKPIFDFASDQLLAMALSMRPGQEIAPLPIDDSIEKDFFESLKTPITISEEDSDAVKQLKQDVIAARQTALEMTRQGMTFREILAEHQRLHNNNAATTLEAQRMVDELIADGDIDLAQDFAIKVNGQFNEKGIAPVIVPKHAIKQQQDKTK